MKEHSTGNGSKPVVLNLDGIMGAPWEFKKILPPGSHRRHSQIIAQGVAWPSRYLKGPQVILSHYQDCEPSHELNNHFNNLILCPRSELLYLNEPTRAVINLECLPRIETDLLQLECRKQTARSCLVCLPHERVRSGASENQKPGLKS